MKEKYEVGKWYKLPSTGNYIVKYSGDWNKCTEYITDKHKYYSDGGSANGSNAILVSLNEIRQYLPDGHPDKFSPISKEQKNKILQLIREI